MILPGRGSGDAGSPPLPRDLRRDPPPGVRGGHRVSPFAGVASLRRKPGGGGIGRTVAQCCTSSCVTAVMRDSEVPDFLGEVGPNGSWNDVIKRPGLRCARLRLRVDEVTAQPTRTGRIPNLKASDD